MAETLICGAAGSVTLVGKGCKIAAWTANLVREVGDVTGYGDAGWRTAKNGLRSMSGKISGYLTKGSSLDQPGFGNFTSCDAPESIVLTADTGCTYTFNGYITNIEIDHAVSAVGIPISFSFVSSGAVVEAWVLT